MGGALGLGRLAAHVVDERADPEREVQQVRDALQPRGLLGRLGLLQRGVELEPEHERDRPQPDQGDDELALAGAACDRQRPALVPVAAAKRSSRNCAMPT